MGITNGAFPTEREENEGCDSPSVPTATSGLDGATPPTVLRLDRSVHVLHALPGATHAIEQAARRAESITRGKALFSDTGCALCHTPSLKTYNASVAAMRYKTANLFSDLLLHDMGRGLADGVQQGQAGGPRVPHRAAVGAGPAAVLPARRPHVRPAPGDPRAYSDGSEANAVTQRYFNLGDTQQQDLLNFLRSL